MKETEETERLKKGKERLRTARKSIGLTQKQMGMCVSVAKTTICRAERENDPYFLPDEILIKYSEKFHKPLLYWKGEEPSDIVSKLKARICELEKDVQEQDKAIKNVNDKLAKIQEDLSKFEKDFC